MILPTLLVEVVLHLANGVTAYDVFRSAPQIVFLPLFLTAVLMMLASLTPNLPRLVFLGIGFVATLTLLQFVVNVLYIPPSMNASLRVSALIIVPVLFLMGSLIVISYQYLTSRTTLSTILAISGVALTILLMYLWPWDLWGTVARQVRVLDTKTVNARLEKETIT